MMIMMMIIMMIIMIVGLRMCAERRSVLRECFVLASANPSKCGVPLNIISGCCLYHSVKKVIVTTFRDVH